MQPSEIAASYDAIAHHWLTSHLETNGVRQHEQAIGFCGGSGLALDVGSGCNGRFIRLLQRHGYTVEGLDLSAQMLALARTRHPEVTFYHADVCIWTPPKSYDFITAWDSIWHVPLNCNADVVRKLCLALNPGGVFIWTTGGLDEPSEKLDASMGPPMYYGVLGIPQTLQTVAEAGCVCRHLEYDQLPEKHVFLIAQKR